MGRKIIVIAGPTGSGKTSLAIKIAEHLNSEIISADSRQIYKYLNIGTAKPTIEELKKIKHRFIDYLEPEEDYNVSRYEKEALQIISELFEVEKTPVVAGGSGLYIKALTDGIFDVEATDEDLRKRLKSKMELFGSEMLLEELKIIDPEGASKMLPQNWKRIIRALEVFYITGKTITDLQKEYKRKDNLDFSIYALLWKRETLYSLIEERVDNMISQGLIDEVKNLLNMGYDRNLNSLNTVGYKEIFDYLDNIINLDEAIALIKRNTRHYAKRQLTWFNADKRIKWINISDKSEIYNIAEQIIDNEKIN